MADEDLPDINENDAADDNIGSSLGATIIAGSEDGALMDVSIDIVAVLGTAELKISQILQLGRGAVVELERLIGEPVELRAERQLVARGEVVVIDDKLAVQITEVVSTSCTNKCYHIFRYVIWCKLQRRRDNHPFSW